MYWKNYKHVRALLWAQLFIFIVNIPNIVGMLYTIIMMLESIYYESGSLSRLVATGGILTGIAIILACFYWWHLKIVKFLFFSFFMTLAALAIEVRSFTLGSSLLYHTRSIFPTLLGLLPLFCAWRRIACFRKIDNLKQCAVQAASDNLRFDSGNRKSSIAALMQTLGTDAERERFSKTSAIITTYELKKGQIVHSFDGMSVAEMNARAGMLEKELYG